MSLRTRSAVGAVLFCGGFLAAIWGMVLNQKTVLGAALASVLAGVAVIGWAFRDAAREINSMHGKYDALLRAELPPEKRGPRTPPQA